ncbi:hypothetical protein OEA41_002289 [Lepraria neglecta]|uniref:Uncharacterized protein n=1 Tax=Lepraria neglecta TaxID=209136 RepID=A0AAD9ZC76_9LECA|nr:hypothetical protein OEA41_002289 [Lepraria neglecta]
MEQALFTINVALVGVAGVGKTSYINQLTTDEPLVLNNYVSTIPSYDKTTRLSIQTTAGPVHFAVRDTVGESHTTMLKHLTTDCTILMYDVNDASTLTAMMLWQKHYINNPTSIICLVGNKAEDGWLTTRQVSVQDAAEVGNQYGMGSYQINTRLGRNVYFPLLYLARKVLQLEGLELFSEVPFVYDETAEIERENYLKAQPQVLDLELEQVVSMRGKGAAVTAEQQQRIRDAIQRRSQRGLTKDDRDMLMRQQAKYRFLKRVDGTYKLAL